MAHLSATTGNKAITVALNSDGSKMILLPPDRLHTDELQLADLHPVADEVASNLRSGITVHVNDVRYTELPQPYDEIAGPIAMILIGNGSSGVCL